MADFKAGEKDYRSRKLSTFDQLFIVKRLGGAIKNALTPETVTLIADSVAKRDGEEVIDPLKFFVPFAEALGKMPDEDLTFILNTCMKVCHRGEDGNRWSPLVVNGVQMYQDITAAQTLLIAYNVLAENLGGFFDELLSMWAAETEKASA